MEGNLTVVTDTLGQRYLFRYGTYGTEEREEIFLHRHLS
ncbi:hypothetical protein EXT51_21075 [Pectobacterium carotovorum subsp. carotovorum]|nr:hypothetical protein [Pectobacterium carotovorum subsp. carotovorum]